MIEQKVRAGRNRTICLSPDETSDYLGKCIDVSEISNDTTLVDRIICGDCLRVLRTIDDRSVDLMIVDPPYNIDKTFSTMTFHKMDSDRYEAFTREWIHGILRVLKETASVYICCDWKTSIIIGRVLHDYFVIQNRITWQREKGRGARYNWKNGMEDIWFVTMSDKYTFNVESVKQRRKVIAPYRIDGRPKDWVETENGNFRDTYPSNFWDDISIPYWSMPDNTDHPTQKPEKLFAKLILASSNPGDLVVDPFAGVGTSCVVAKKLNRHFIGIEKEPEYCALSVKRLEIAESDISIQGYHNGIFWERNSLSDQKRKPAKTTHMVQDSLFGVEEVTNVQ